MNVDARTSLAAAALFLGALAAVAREPHAASSGIDSARILREIAEEKDHITAVELAAWIRDRKSGLRVLDVRTADEFEEFHIPTAEHVPLPVVAGLRVKDGETIVLYSSGGAHAAQAWVLLRSGGDRKVYFLSGGLDEWVESVLEPTLPAEATAVERVEFERAAELSRYFGGSPRLNGSPKAASDPTSAPVHRRATDRRRGC